MNAAIVMVVRQLKQEKKDIRLAIVPLLQAEEDARFVEQVNSTFLLGTHLFFPRFSSMDINFLLRVYFYYYHLSKQYLLTPLCLQR